MGAGAVAGARATLVKFTVFALVAVLLFVGLFRLMSNDVGGDTRTWTAEFTVVSGLRAGDDVRVAGVKVGRVDDIRVGRAGPGGAAPVAEVRFRMRADQAVYAGTTLTLRYQNLLGQRYLALGVGADRGARLEPGTTIPARATSAGFDLTALLNGFQPLFNALQPSEVNKLATNIVQVLQGESGTVEQLLRRTASATTYLSSKDAVFARVLKNLTPVLEDLDERSGQFDATVVQLRQLMTGLARERGTFGRSIDSLGGLLDSTSSLLAELRPDIRRDVRSLRRTARLLSREQVRLAQTVDTLPVLLGTFARAMSYGNYLNVYLCNLGLDVVGPTVWIGGNGGPRSEACR